MKLGDGRGHAPDKHYEKWIDPAHARRDAPKPRGAGLAKADLGNLIITVKMYLGRGLNPGNTEKCDSVPVGTKGNSE